MAVRRTLAAIGAGLGIALVLYAGQRLDLVAIIALMAGVVLLAMSGRRLLPPGTVAVRNGLPAVIAFRGMLAGAFFAVDALLPLTLTAVHGYGPTAAGIPLMTGAVGWSTGSWVQGRYPDVARYLFVRTGFILLAVSCVAMVLIVTPAGVAWVAYPIWLVAGTGMGLAMPGVGILLLELSPPEQRGANAAAMQICDVSVSALCIGAAGVLVAASENGLLPLRVAVGTVDLAMGMFAVAGALLAYRVRATTRTELVSA
ncbi:MAG: hypothetical protein H0V10_14070 [Geodermatophilaceae bacterium]|nr:hypothetical protein [Geodermatophilaceae bacterium]